jgi:hypothetical protein
MTTTSKTIVFVALFAIASLANAAGFAVFDNIESCEIARSAGRAKIYTPTTKAPFQGGKGWTKKVVPEGGACLGEAHVLEDGAPKNGKAVFVAEGFVYWEHTSGAFRMNDCSNPFGQISFGNKKQQSVVATCDDCNNNVTNVTNVTNITEVVNVRQVCTINGQEVAVVNGQCPVPTMTVALPVKVEPTTQVTAQPAAACTTCTPTPKFSLDRKVPRTDGRCVVAVTYQGVERFIRLSPEKGTGRLMAAVVRDVGGEFDRSLPIAYVGDDSSFLHANATCQAAFQGFTSERSYGPTTRRLGLPGCTIKGRVE